MTYDELVAACTGQVPYDYQRRVAEEGLPELLTVPTGAGKTMAVVLGWLYRRHFHPDVSVRASTPRWLVVCQPMRTLVEQVRNDTERWLAALAATKPEAVPGVNVYLFMGGEPTAANDWRLHADEDAIVIGTQDMLLSRALNRGFGSSRNLWPVEFGVLNSGAHWVFDEIQLMGAGVPTGRQLEAFRRNYPSLLPHGSTWMSATVDHRSLQTVDNRSIESRVELSESDRNGHLSTRLTARKVVRETLVNTDPKHREKELAKHLVESHRSGSLTLAILNTVSDAQDLHAAVEKLESGAVVVLLHSRYRRTDRKRLVRQVTESVDPSGPGLICISTQVVEAGMDLNAACLFTEAAPWSSIVQRIGRCNRTGTIDDAEVHWFSPKKPDKPLPYDSTDVAAAIETLRSLEGQSLQADRLAERGPKPRLVTHPVLRRRDLQSLFDTSPEISGADIDVAPYVRDIDDDRTVHIAWRSLTDPFEDERFPSQAELCPAPLGKALTDWVERRNVLRYDLIERKWKKASKRDLRPNALLLAEASTGGYSTDRGLDFAHTGTVPAPIDDDSAISEIAEYIEAADDDSASFDQSKWVTLSGHLLDAEREARNFCDAVHLPPGISAVMITAARVHDIGKAHAVFQDTMQRSAAAHSWNHFDEHAPLAKSRGRFHHKKKYFRHELASALALLGEAAPALSSLPEEDRFLCVYLVAAHHGKIRMTLRSMPGEPTGTVFGVSDGDSLPTIRIGVATLPNATLEPSQYTGVGISTDGTKPWRDFTDDLFKRFGPFTLALMESVVRFSDWNASSRPTPEGLPA